MSKNTPTTQYLDFNNYIWDLSTVSYTKEFNKFYSKPEGEIVITNLSIVKTNESNIVPVANVIAIPIQVIETEKIEIQKIIKYQTNKFDIPGGYVNINLSYKLKENTLTAELSFQADTSVMP